MSPRPAVLISKIHAWAAVSPLLSAVFAPFSVLFDIPALTEPWFIHSDLSTLLDPDKANSAPDDTISVVLSAIGLGFNVVANALLIVRFSTSARWWRVATRVSLGFWFSKVIIALVNLSVFGRARPDTVRGEGLWCAVVSLIICALITFLLVFHWGFEARHQKHGQEPTGEQLAVRVAGRHFMINVTLFVIDLGVLALLASRVEDWTYLQGIYFGIITFLTVGFGDFYPTHAVTRVALFIFAILGIAQLGNIVSMLVTFFSSRAREKRATSRAEFERKRQEEEEQKPGAVPDLHAEIQFLHKLGQQQETRVRLEQLGTSVSGLVIFWFVGAAVFCKLEGWAYGTALYFSYVSFLTIGYGDLAPTSSAGRVVFVLYSLIAVPLMASFAVQAVQQVFAAISKRQYEKSKAKRGLEPTLAPSSKKSGRKGDVEEGLESDTKAKADTGTSKSAKLALARDGFKFNTYGEVVPHMDLTEQWHEQWEKRVRKYRAEGFSEGMGQKLAEEDTKVMKQERNGAVDGDDEEGAGDANGTDIDDEATGDAEAEEQEREFDEDAKLTERILELAISLEWRARKLLIMHLDNEEGKAARIVLKADRNVQLRVVRGLVRDITEAEGQQGEGGKREASSGQTNESVTLEEDSESTKDNSNGVTSKHPLLEGARTSKIIQHILRDDPDDLSFPSARDERKTLEEIRQYREDFAGILAAGSRLMGLKGNERALFERRRLRELRRRSMENDGV